MAGLGIRLDMRSCRNVATNSKRRKKWLTKSGFEIENFEIFESKIVLKRVGLVVSALDSIPGDPNSNLSPAV
jgi:hypothetical protein